MNWKNLKNLIRKELKESNLLTENVPSCCGYVNTGQGFACCKGYHQHMGQYPCAGGSQNQWTNAMQGNGEWCSGKTAGPGIGDDDIRIGDDDIKGGGKYTWADCCRDRYPGHLCCKKAKLNPDKAAGGGCCGRSMGQACPDGLYCNDDCNCEPDTRDDSRSLREAGSGCPPVDCKPGLAQDPNTCRCVRASSLARKGKTSNSKSKKSAAPNMCDCGNGLIHCGKKTCEECCGPKSKTVRPGFEPSGKPKIIRRKSKIKEATSVTAGNTKFNLRTGVNKNPTKLGIKIQFEPLEGGLESETKAKLEVALQEKLNTALSEYDMQISKDTDVPRAEVIGFFIPLSQVKNLIIKALTGKKVEDPTVPAPPPEGGGMEPEGEMNEAEGDPCHEDCQRGMWECSCCMCANHGNVNNACHKCDRGRNPAKRGGEKHADNQTKDTLDDDDIEEMIAEQLLSEMKVGTLNEISKVVAKEDFYEFINKGNNIIRTLEENNFSMKESKNYLKYLIKHNIM